MDAYCSRLGLQAGMFLKSGCQDVDPSKKKQVAYHYSSHLDSHSPIVEL